MNDCSSDRRNELHARPTTWNDSLRAIEPGRTLQSSARDLLLGDSMAMRILDDQIGKLAPTRASVLIVGEPGSGKEVVARALHDRSSRSDCPFVSVDCDAIAPSLIEAELFGHERGSFTGAVRAHAGYFERAADGTLVLDEITEIPLEMQAKLLRVLESGQLLRVGGRRNVHIRCRVLATTQRDPTTAVADGRLRADLLSRLAVYPLRVPALREREADATLLAREFLRRLNVNEQLDKRLSADSLLFIRQYGWPGNVRELRNAVQRAFILADDELDIRAALGPGTNAGLPDDAEAPDRLRISVGMTLAEVEHEMVIATLKRCGGNKTRTAAMLGVSLKTLYNRLNEYRAAGFTPQGSAGGRSHTSAVSS